MPKERNLYDIKDPKEMLGKAILGGFLGVLSILFISYLVFCLSSDSLLARTDILTYYSQGSAINEIIGLWAVAFTPVSSLSTIAPVWVQDWYYYLAPCLVAGFAIALKTKSIRWSLVGGVFFVIWGILFALIFVYILPIFGIVDPTSINASLISAFSDVYTHFNPVYLSFINLFHSVYMGWCIAGTIELAGASTLIAIPLALLFGSFAKLFSK